MYRVTNCVVWIVVALAVFTLGFAQTAQAGFVSAVEALNPLAFWQLQTNTGGVAVNDGTGGAANEGTFGSGVTLVDGPSLPGLSGKAAEFNGSDAITASATGFPYNSDARTLTAWVNTTTALDWVGILCYGVAYSYQDVVFGEISGHVGFTQYGGGVQGAKKINDGAWHFVALTIDPNGAGSSLYNPLCSLYVDGQFDASSVMAVGTGVGSNIVTIGSGVGYAGSPLSGDVADPAVFTSALSGSTIQSLYTAATVPEPSTIVLLGTGLIALLAYAWRKRN